MKDAHRYRSLGAISRNVSNVVLEIRFVRTFLLFGVLKARFFQRFPAILHTYVVMFAQILGKWDKIFIYCHLFFEGFD